MKLKGAEVRNIYGISTKIGGEDADLRIRIPYYQRPYKWDTKHIENLFKDFFENQENRDDKEYFIGSVVLVKNDDKKEIFYDVVDGQQRTTTVFLLNYILFLVQRSHIEELFDSKKTSSIPQAISDLINTIHMLFILDDEEDTVLNDYCVNIADKLDDLGDKTGDAKDKMADDLLQEFRNLFGLPQSKDLSDKEGYRVFAIQQMQNYLSNYDLTLNYKRESYNDLIKEALSKIVLVYSTTYAPELLCPIELEEDAPIWMYVNAVNTEFDFLINRSKKHNKPIDKIKALIEDMKGMLENLSFCKVLTGDENDAYTLFEVLNDRALAVEDLELVKNMFFRKYCRGCADSEPIKDKNIEELDDLWVNTIFKGCGVAQTQLIAYCASVFLTGTSDLVTNKGQRYREALEKMYFNGKKVYEYESIKFDFQIFYAMRIITDKFELRYNSTNKFGLIAENDINKSCIYKALNLIHSMGYTGVMPALTNVIICSYLDINNSKPIDMDDFSNYIDQIIDNKAKLDEYAVVYDCAEMLRKTILLADGYEKPREIARFIIERNNYEKTDYNAISMKSEDEKELKEQYEKWTMGWRYGSDKQNYRLKVLFMNLYKAEKKDDKLLFPTAKKCFADNIEVALDHLDAQKIDISAEEKYFKPSDVNDDRNNYIDSMGNMMILDGKNNGNKNNKPLCKSLEYHRKLSENWLVDEIEEMLNSDDYSVEKKSGTDTFRVANEKFFNERTKRLQRYFFALINRKDGDDEVDIEES